MSTELLHVLRAANAEVHSFLRLGSRERREYSIVNMRIQVLSQKLLQVTRQLPVPATPHQFDAETQAELDRYVKHLKELKISLAALHAKALQDRDRLAAERAHSRAAHAWLSSMKDTT